MKIKVNDIELFYKKSGSGAPVLLLHGNGETHEIFDALAARLSKKFSVFAMDSRNHGQSSMTEVYSYDVMAEDVFGYIEALGLGTVNVVGFSDGAIAALLLAMKHPQAVAKMALLGVNLKPSDFKEPCFAAMKKHFDETGDPLYRLMLEQPCIELEDIKNIATPTLFVAAEHDIFKAGLYENLLEAMPEARFKTMPGHTHDSYVVGEDLLYPDLLGFF